MSKKAVKKVVSKKPAGAKKIAPVASNIGQGDKLARGAVKASFNMPLVDQKTWNKIFNQKPEPEKKAVYLFKCPVHGVFQSEKEFFLSGGYPKLDELSTGKCPNEECGEKSEYAGFQPV